MAVSHAAHPGVSILAAHIVQVKCLLGRILVGRAACLWQACTAVSVPLHHTDARMQHLPALCSSSVQFWAVRAPCSQVRVRLSRFWPGIGRLDPLCTAQRRLVEIQIKLCFCRRRLPVCCVLSVPNTVVDAGSSLYHSRGSSSRRLTFTVVANAKKCLGCTKEGTRRCAQLSIPPSQLQGGSEHIKSLYNRSGCYHCLSDPD